MHRTTTRLGILFAAMLAITALTPPGVIPPGDDPLGAVPAMAAETPAPPAPVTPPRAPRAPRSPSPAEVPTPALAPDEAEAPEAPVPEIQVRVATPRGRFGFAFDCDGCYSKAASPDSAPVYTFTSRPHVYSVEPGSPAARAGFRRGDVITHVDGASILTPEGGRRFGASVPGQTVRWRVLRAGEPRELVATAIEPPGRRERIVLRDLSRELRRLSEISDTEELQREVREINRQLDQLRRQEQNRLRIEQKLKQSGRLRYAGVVGDTKVEVRGSGQVVVSETDSKERLVINLGDSVVLIEVAAATPKKPK